jgi:integrase
LFLPSSVTIRRAKTDQDAQGDTVGVPYSGAEDICPVRAYREWLEKSAIVDGPVFRAVTRHGKMGAAAVSPAAIALIVKRAVVTAALSEGMTKEEARAMAQAFSAHSLRAGHATSAAQNDAPGHAIQRQLRHVAVVPGMSFVRP